ncbi:MAG: glycosyltransferase family 2 protein [Candidatus Omnitrophica bacterium]|nr:glycosyltransferase family 2 protein [Candidatus Omnitrophota bacterium]
MLPACLQSITSWVDEIFIVDSFSTDHTLAIAEQFNVKVFQHAFDYFAAQRNWAQDCLPLRHEWILHLDADERVSPALRREIENTFARPHSFDGFMVSRKTIFRNRWIRFGGHYPVYHLKLFKKTKGRSEQRFYDQHFIVDGAVGFLRGDVDNIINPDIREWKAQHAKAAVLEAREILFNKKRMMHEGFLKSPIARRNWLRYRLYYRLPLFVRCAIYFLYRMVFRVGFLDGAQGIRFHILHGFWYRLMVDYQVAVMQKGNNVYPWNQRVSS